MRIKHFLLLGAAATLLLPNIGTTQPRDRSSGGGGFPGGGGGFPGGGGGFPGGGSGFQGGGFPGGGFQGGGGIQGGGGRGAGGFGGRGGFSLDPNENWMRLTGGKDAWIRSEISDPNQQRIFDFTARMAGSTNGVITKDQYMAMSQNMAARFGGSGGSGMRAGGFPGMGGTPGAGGGPPSVITMTPGGSSASPSPGGPSSPMGGDPRAGMMDGFLQMRFNNYDRNGDGVLNSDEMPESLRIELDKWDANHDHFIDFTEYKEYARGRMQQMQSERGEGGSPWGGWQPDTPLPEEEEKKPVVYRAGSLPRELPSWFRELDTDPADAQVALYEWKHSSRSIEEFVRMDRNNDGFLTVDEVLYFTGKLAKSNGSPGTGAPPFMMGMGGAGGGFPGGGGFGAGGGFPGGGFPGGGMMGGRGGFGAGGGFPGGGFPGGGMMGGRGGWGGGRPGEAGGDSRNRTERGGDSNGGRRGGDRERSGDSNSSRQDRPRGGRG